MERKMPIKAVTIRVEGIGLIRIDDVGRVETTGSFLDSEINEAFAQAGDFLTRMQQDWKRA